MFTVKMFRYGGHTLVECEHLCFEHGKIEDGLPVTIDRLEYVDQKGNACVIDVGADTIFVMNSAGKTIADYQPYPHSAPMRWAVDPDAARREAKNGNELAKRYLGKIGDGEPKAALPTA